MGSKGASFFSRNYLQHTKHDRAKCMFAHRISFYGGGGREEGGLDLNLKRGKTQ